MSQLLVNDTSLTAVANEIRSKGGTSEQLTFPQGFVDAIEAIPSGGSSGPSHYCTFTAEQANSTIKLTCANNGAQYIYSTDNTTWSSYTSNTVITLTNVGDYVSFAGVGNWRYTFSSSVYSQFVMTGKIAGSGDANAMLDSEFDGCVNYCCYYMFVGCRSLTTAPELPATTLAESCYQYMFTNCDSLTTAPELPATTLVGNCYAHMFDSCSSLPVAPELPATTLANSCYAYMFQNCSSITTAPELPATTLVSSCYNYMFIGCRGLITAPELPATTLKSSCYAYMFKGCSSLTTAPELPAETLVSSCYNYMFQNCSLLTSVTVGATTWNTSYANQWLNNVASSGTVTCPTACTIPSDSTSGIPTGWTRVNV